MFLDVGWSELLIVALVALIVVGPKELPGLMRGIGNFIHKVKSMASSFQQQFERAVDEGEFGKIREEVEEIGREMSPDKLMGDLDHMDEYEQIDPDAWNDEILEAERQRVAERLKKNASRQEDGDITLQDDEALSAPDAAVSGEGEPVADLPGDGKDKS